MLPITRATVQHFCRVCLLEFEFNAKDNTHNIEVEQGLERWFRVTTATATSVEIGNNSSRSSCRHLPKKLCHICYTKTKLFYEYREKAVCATEAFKELISENLHDTVALSNLQNFCRTCLKKLKSCNAETNLCENEELRRWLFECTELSLDFTSSADDGLNVVCYEPKYVCINCYRKLRNYLEFRGIAQQSFEYLENILGPTTTTAVDEKQIGDSNDTAALEKNAELIDRLEKSENKLNLTENTHELALTSIFVEQLPTIDEINATYYSDNSPESMTSRHSAADEKCFTDESGDEDIKKQFFEIKMVDKIPLEEGKTSVNKMRSLTLTDSDKLTDNKTKESKRYLNAPKSIKCEQCNKQFRKQSTYNAHVRAIHEGIKETYTCEFCSKLFYLCHHLRRHRKEVHKVDVLQEPKVRKRRKMGNSSDAIISNGDSHTCAICCRIFKRRDHLVHHISSVHQKMRPHKCSHCNKSFGARKTLRVHEMGHTNTRPYICEYCPKRFIQITDWRRHTEIHTTSPELLCPICKRAKSDITELQEHLAQHKANMQHQCPKCGKIFKKRSNLIEHDNTVHLKLRPHKCNYCEATFAFRKTCRIHERTHTGERPEVCHICQMSFAQPSSLRSHMKRHELAKKDDNQKSTNNNINANVKKKNLEEIN